ncbi:S-adenosyl-L-methionine-dependent methyltransferase [Parathielavia appendiculata]|uniref:S-adenosyl-L-methionine-dependent methyltransferase n=1 Tax=Parathielavia appendiculata TaxID=2587402 RepID=A0AAN6Z3B5_9PEZI|nr:S-adenosyl-L-methionine-dependent methyltransferase [Parathielavia appendiculata]
MKVREEDIKSAGLTLLYEPDWPSDPIVDILLVHGVGGHPVRSWKCDGVGRTPTSLKPTIRTPGIKRRLTKIWPSQPLRRSNSEPLLAKEQHPLNRSRTLLWKNAARSSSRVNLGPYVEPAKPGSSGGAKSFVRKASVKSPSRSNLAGVAEPIRQGARFREVDWYWPLDFLPASCPNARIFTWGYQTLVADKKPIPLQGDIFAHAGELLVELASTRAVLGARARPIVLRLSEAERDGPLKEILLSTAAVVFLGSPHRGTEQCNLGDAIRIMASVTMLVDPDDPALQELCGANSVEAELARQTFVRLWNSYNFRVKTFQESVIPNHRYPELRAETTIRRLASFIGDPREGAETICALHDSICKFVSAENPGYRALARTLAAFITVEEHRRHVLNVKEKECLAALVSPNPASPETHPPSIYPGTCLWLYDMPDFQAWHSRSGSNKRKILWIRGGPGCGKTVLLRSLRRRLEKQWGPAGASFIWSSDEADDVTPGTFPASREGSPVAIYRSLLAQLFPQDAHLRKALLALYNKLPSVPRTFDDTQIVSFFADYYINQRIETPARRTFIFLEVGDDACTGYVHELLSRLGQLAHNSDFSICLASSHHPEILEEENVISKPMHLRNAGDILRYVNLNLVAEWEERDRTAMHIAQKSAGVFLWAEIVVNVLNAAIIEGATQEMIEYTLDEVPGDLHGLYEWMLSTFNNRERAESLILFQWVMLAAEPMRLNDLFLAVRLTEPNPFAVYQDLGPLMAFDIGAPFSMRELRQLRNSEITSDTPYQFHRWLRARSIGLLELRADNCHQPTANEPLGLQRVHPIHSSVRTFFLSGRGFACLAVGNPSIPASLPTADFLDITHYALLRACLTYLNMRDFESLCHGAAHRRKPTANLNFDLTTTTVPVTTEWYHPPTITAPSQRHLIMSSYPFLYYAVSHLLFHLLSPRRFRYFLPQRELLAVMKANNFRLWKRWTSLLGTHDPAVIIARHALPTSSDAGVIRIGVARLLSPVYGARFRLERVLRKVARLAQTCMLGCAFGPLRPFLMYAIRSHVRATVLSRATRCVFAQQATLRTSTRQTKRVTTNPETTKEEETIAKIDALGGAFFGLRNRKKGKNNDKYRVNIVSEKLCDDVINYIKPTLARHKGCDLVDIFPGTGIWSQKLHNAVQPRTHMLMEPDADFYKPFLEPLLERPGTKLVPESGIVWEELNKVLNPTVLPLQVERKFKPEETPPRNDTLLVSMNLAMSPRRRFRSFDSVVALVIFQLISSIRPGALFQKYGLVRMLIWMEDGEKVSILPRSAQRRKRLAIEAELSTDYVCEIAGAGLENAKQIFIAARDDRLETESIRKALQRMREHGFVLPPGREPEHLLDYQESLNADGEVASGAKHRVHRASQAALEKMEAAYARGEFEEGSKEYVQLRNLRYKKTYTEKRDVFIGDLLREREAIHHAYVDAGDDKGKLEEVFKRGQAWSDKVSATERGMRGEVNLHRDNWHLLHQDPPVLNWDRRYVEPLRVRPDEFYPPVPCALLDIQPKAAAPVLRDIGPNSTRGGDTFDLMLRGLVQRGVDPLSHSLDTVAAGASDGIIPHCPSLTDPRLGGSPLPGHGELTARALNQRQLIDIIEQWMKWPFRPHYSELVCRTVEEPHEDVGESGMLGNKSAAAFE